MQNARNLVVGLTTLAGVVGLAFLLFLFGYVPVYFSNGYRVTLDMADAVELNPGSDLKLSGIPVGTVDTIAFKGGQEQGVLVTATIREGVRIPTGTIGEVDTDLLGGTATIRLRPPARVLGFLPTDGSAVMFGELGSLAGAFASLSGLTNHLDGLAQEWEQVGENVNRILVAEPGDGGGDGGGADGDDSRSDLGSGGPTDLAAVVVQINDRLAQLESIMDGVEAYTANPELAADLQATVANARAVSERVDARFDALTRSYLELADEAKAATRNFNATLAMAREGDGTLGKLLTNPAIFDNFATTATRISAMADEATLLIQKIQAEGVPLRF